MLELGFYLLIFKKILLKYMDPVSQLLLENIERAKSINHNLIKSGESIIKLEKNNQEIKQEIGLGSKILNSFSNLFNFSWNFKSFYPSNVKLDSQESSSESNINLEKSELSELKELTHNMGKILDSQNNTLLNLNQDLDQNLHELNQNQKKITHLLSKN